MYDAALERGLIKDHMDFYNRFDPHQQIGKVSVNLSCMTDEAVQRAFADLYATYNEEKGKLLNWSVLAIEWGIKKLYGADTRIQASMAGKFAGKFQKKIYSFSYDAVQNVCDACRLRLRGLDESR